MSQEPINPGSQGRSSDTGRLQSPTSTWRSADSFSKPSDRKHSETQQQNQKDAKQSPDEIQHQRCFSGYLFDCARNKEIVENNPKLFELWESIQRINHMATNSGMSQRGLDFSYLGVADVWQSDMTALHPSRVTNRNTTSRKDCSNIMGTLLASKGYGKFEGGSTAYAGLRQVGLAVCGWKFDEKRLRERCAQIMSKREYYRAVAVAFCHGDKALSFELLRYLTRTEALENSGLVAVMASERVSEEQRELCRWMAEDAEDPYLRGLLAYFCEGEWGAVVYMEELPLRFRVAVALKRLSDDKLTTFLADSTRACVEQGDIAGVILTGLAESSMDLFQNYAERTSDVQTAVLATSFAYPQYVADERWQTWKSSYFRSMQKWQAYMDRARFITQHKRMSPRPNPRTQNAGSAGHQDEPRGLTIRCNYCQISISGGSRDVDGDAANSGKTAPAGGGGGPGGPGGRAATGPPKSGPAQPEVEGLTYNTTLCRNCGHHLSRCGICMHWLGDRGPTKPGPVGGGLMLGGLVGEGAVGGKGASGSARVKPGGEGAVGGGAKGEKSHPDQQSIGDLQRQQQPPQQQLPKDLLANFIGLCLSCNHGFHLDHGRSWFAQHDEGDVGDGGEDYGGGKDSGVIMEEKDEQDEDEKRTVAE
ncbi:MAG: hypothetical protein M1831_000131 [Alyxoria varia]|nr:MAG: hypothetical protein M1831_000131 [Alyxoria varia]